MAKVPALKKEDLERYYELDAERLALARRVKNLATLQEELEEQFLEHVKFHGGKERCVSKFGYRLIINLQRARVQWKDHFLKLCGADGPRRAEEIVQQQPTKEVLEIEPPPRPAV